MVFLEKLVNLGPKIRLNPGPGYVIPETDQSRALSVLLEMLSVFEDASDFTEIPFLKNSFSLVDDLSWLFVKMVEYFTALFILLLI